MAVSNPASLSSVRTEFGGGSPPANLKAYNRNGTYVPTNGTTGSISTDPNTLALSQFNGAANTVETCTVTAHTVYDDDADGGGASANISAGNNGVLSWFTNNFGSGVYSGQWLTGGTPSQWEVLAATVSGTPGTGTMSTWLALSTTRTWTRVHSGAIAGVRTWTFSLTFRKIGTTTPTYAANMTLQAESYGPECVVAGSWMQDRRQVGMVRPGDEFLTHRPEDGFHRRPLQRVNEGILVPCSRIITASEAALSVSNSTPFNLRTALYDRQEGHWRRAKHMRGQEVMVERNGILTWEPVIEVQDLGEQLVIPMSFGGRSFAAGDKPNALIYSHNMAKLIR